MIAQQAGSLMQQNSLTDFCKCGKGPSIFRGQVAACAKHQGADKKHFLLSLNYIYLQLDKKQIPPHQYLNFIIVLNK